MFAPIPLMPSGPAATQAAPPSPSLQHAILSTAQAMHSSGPGVPYGSGASDHPAGHCSLSRRKQRSRDRQSLSRHTSVSATPPAGGRRMGPQENMDWNDLIGGITDPSQ